MIVLVVARGPVVAAFGVGGFLLSAAYTAPPLLDQDGEQIRQWLGLVPAGAAAADSATAGAAGEGR